ncbi:MAG: flagellar hook-associated protein FlgL [Acidobacteria bacterium]|nr:flagellar hook-associated protein FlgL [Acidobacteriota bacterium]
MSLRTPTNLMNRQALLDLQRTKERISVLQEQIATGKRIVRLSDDPTGSALILDFQNSIARNHEFLRQAEAAGSFLSGAESALGSLNDALTRLLEIGQEGLTGTSGATGRAALGEETDGLRSSILSIANTQEQGKYLFAGTATLTQPFSGPPAGPITYAGNAGLINLEVSPTHLATTNLPGGSLFFGPGGQGSATDVFQAVTDLRDGLRTNNVALIQTAVTNLEAIHARVNQSITDLGGRQATLLQVRDTLEGFNLNLQSILNSEQDLDYPSAIMDFSTEQTAQQATLATLAKSGQRNLFDYLG